MTFESQAGSALAGIRVIDFGQYIAGPLAAMLLGDYGAEVVRVDPPAGPRWKHPANAVLQRNKRSIILDLHDERDRENARTLVASADVVIEGFRPGVMSRLGLSPDESRARNRGLVWCSIPGFGHDDPRAQLQGWEGIVCAAAGVYAPKAFTRSGGPRFSAIPHASNFAGFIAAHSIVAALIGRERDGHGDHIEVPLFDAAFEASGPAAEAPSSIDLSFLGTTAGITNPAVSDAALFTGRDGRQIRKGTPARGFHRLWDAYLPTELKEAQDEDSVRRASALIAELFGSKDAVEWERIGQAEFGAALATFQSAAEWLQDDHAISSDTVLLVEDPEYGPTRQAGFACRLSETPARVDSPRRTADADGAAVREELAGRHQARVPQGVADVAGERAMPLAGVRIVDFSILLAGPGACRVLAEYGADVIKVNKAAVGWGEIDPLTDDAIMFIGHRTVGAGKRTMFLDLKSAAGQEVATRLLDSADVVHHNFTPAGAARLDLVEDRVRAERPGVVFSVVNLHSAGGWREDHRGHEDHSQAVTGVSVRNGAPGAPEMGSIIVSDNGTAHLSALGVLVALFHRTRTGRGQRVQAALSRTATLSQIPFMVAYEGRTWDEPRGPEATGWSVFNRLYQAADAWFYLVAPSEDARAGVAAVTGLHDLAGLAGRELEDALCDRFRQASAHEWVRRLQSSGVSAHVYRDLADLSEDPLVLDRGLIVGADHPGLGWGLQIGIVGRFASMPDREIAPAAKPGWHTRAVLGELGYSKESIEEMLRDRVVAEARF
jgi:crotonobetainyl-CoA:carnitine CoA-transferase CaiB-like acyl-CoA transferase